MVLNRVAPGFTEKPFLFRWGRDDAEGGLLSKVNNEVKP